MVSRTSTVDWYAVLGVAPTATATEIKSAYRRRIKVVHPDVGGAHDDMVVTQQAYDVLSSPLSRREFDRTRRSWQAPTHDSTAAGDTKPGGTSSSRQSPFTSGASSAKFGTPSDSPSSGAGSRFRQSDSPPSWQGSQYRPSPSPTSVRKSRRPLWWLIGINWAACLWIVARYPSMLQEQLRYPSSGGFFVVGAEWAHDLSSYGGYPKPVFVASIAYGVGMLALVCATAAFTRRPNLQRWVWTWAGFGLFLSVPFVLYVCLVVVQLVLWTLIIGTALMFLRIFLR